ncbi:MAG: GMC family oxidoreductase [Thermodesulfobacteriota bacterium]
MYDFAIVGSGASGGRVAYDLTAAGARCVLVEAGRAFEAATFPGRELDYTAQMFWAGGLEITSDGRLGLLRGKCLGGGTVVNQALMDRGDDLALDDWRDRSGVGFFNTRDLAPDYEAAEAALNLTVISEERRGRSARLFIQALERKGIRWAPLRRAEKDCASAHGSDCLVCLGGCPRDSKQSALVTTIRWARERGLAVETELEVFEVVDRGDRVAVRGRRHGREVEIEAAKAVLAAGALGTTALLLRSSSLRASPALGWNFSCHPQFMSYAVFREPVDAHKGTFQSVKSDDPHLRRAGYKLENVAAPPAATALLIPGLRAEHQDIMKRFRHLACMEVCVRDEPAGRLRLDRRGRLLIEKPLTDQDRRRCREGLDLVMELFALMDPVQVVRCAQPFGLHLMGGCVLGANPDRSVVDPEFRLHEHRNVYVVDSSLFPSAPGLNPCLTILALSHRAARNMIGG